MALAFAGKMLAAGLAGVLCQPATLQAQRGTTAADPPAAVSLRFGPLALAPSMSLTDVGWDSNVFQRQVDEKPVGDFTATARPQVDGWLSLGRPRVHARSSVDFVYFRDHPSESSMDGQHEARIDLPLPVVTPYVSTKWLSAKQRFGFEVDERIRHRDQTFVGGAELRLSPRTGIELTARRSRLEFDRGDAFRDPFMSQFYDYTSNAVAASVRHNLTPLTSLTVTVERNRDRFDLDPTRDSNSLTVGSGVEFKPSAIISGKAFVGWTDVRLVTPGSPRFNTLVTTVDLAYTLLGSTRFIVNAERGVEYSAVRGQQAYLYSGVTVSANHRLGSRWDVGGRTGWHNQSYGIFPPASLSGAEPLEIDFGHAREIVTEYGGDVGYRPRPNTRLAFRLVTQQRDSPIGIGREYQRVTAGWSLTYRF